MRTSLYDLRVAMVAIAACLALFAFYAAYSFAASGPEAQAYAGDLAGLPDGTASTGDTVAVDGTIATDAPLLRHEFVVFERRQTQGAAPKGTEVVTIETGKQPFSIMTPNGAVRVVNDDYRLDRKFTDWTQIERLESPPGLLEGGITISGLERGSPVLAVGVLERDGSETHLRADTVVAGPKDAYIMTLRQGAGRASHAIPFVLGIGLVLLIYAVWDGRRLWRAER